MKRKIKFIIKMLVVTFGLLAFSKQDAYAAVAAKAVALNAQTAQFSAVINPLPASDDGILYLYELKTYENTISPNALPIASTPLAANVSMNFDLYHKQPATRLYSKFVLASKLGGQMVMLNVPQYITNPEILATHNRGRVSLNKTFQHESINNVVLNGSGTGPLATNPVVVLLAKNGTVVTNPACNAADSHPMEKKYYMLNADNAVGVNGLIADCTLQGAYSRGQDFIIGNEVHERVWNYMAYTDWNNYVRTYARAFRVCYNAIKSENANAKVYISLGQDWNRDRPTSHAEYYKYIDAKDFVDIFNAEIMAGGNIDWSIAIHPYTVPLTNARFWNMSHMSQKDANYYAEQIITNKMISFQNLSVETNYLANFRNPNGQVRTMIISEIGVSNTLGDEVQAAALAASWVAYKKNPYISGYMYLNNKDGDVDARLIGKGVEMYNALGTSKEAAMLEWAKAYIGITDWNQILR